VGRNHIGAKSYRGGIIGTPVPEAIPQFCWNIPRSQFTPTILTASTHTCSEWSTFCCLGWVVTFNDLIRHVQTRSNLIINSRLGRYNHVTHVQRHIHTCPADLPDRLARQTCPADLPGRLARQTCPADLPCRLARQTCPADLTS
jgi:hypothetical protein